MGVDGGVPAVLRGLPVGGLVRLFAEGGHVHEHVVLGIRLPTALAAQPVMVAVCAALSWLHFRRDAYTAFEETFLGALLGIAVFGLILLLPLLLAA